MGLFEVRTSAFSSVLSNLHSHSAQLPLSPKSSANPTFHPQSPTLSLPHSAQFSFTHHHGSSCSKCLTPVKAMPACCKLDVMLLL